MHIAKGFHNWEYEISYYRPVLPEKAYFSTITKFRSQNCEIDLEYAGQFLCGNATKMSRVFSAIDNEMIIEVRHVESVKC